jgi:hypothetical protein
MRIRTGLYLLACCCAVLAGCTAAGPKGPDATVTKPAVGRPPAPASEGAALASEAFTAYADLGAAANDGLAPGDTYANLHTACMDAAGYGQYADSTPYSVRANRGIGFPQPYGPWGYIGLSLAEQYGFNPPDTGGPAEFDGLVSPGTSMPAGAGAALGKCFNIVAAFNNAQFATSTVGIYFAIQTSYEKQLVTANQQALNAAVREFKASYARELSKLPALLRTTSATPSLPGPKPRQSAHPAHSRRAANT